MIRALWSRRGSASPSPPPRLLTRPLLAPPQPLLHALLEGGRLGFIREVQSCLALL